MGHGVTALRKNVRAHSRLIIQQGTFVRVGRRRIHTRSEVNKHAVVAVSALDDDRGGIGTETRGMDEILGGQNADLRGPFERSECLIEGQTDRIIVGNEARRLASALKEMGERVGAIFKGAKNARSCGNGHPEIITEQEFNC